MLEKIFTWTKKKEDEEAEPQIQFGRYSDNNKPVEKVEKWNEADALFKEKKYHESIHAFFEYLRDDSAENVFHEVNGKKGVFRICQGSKVIHGFYNEEMLEAEVVLAGMSEVSVAVMRRLLEMNFTLYYTRYALHGQNLCMLFDSDTATANPSKLYYGLKELATKADKQDDLLVQDFSGLHTVGTEHIEDIPLKEKAVKFRHFKKWIADTLKLVQSVEADKFSGGIAYLLLSLAYRIDFLIVPAGKLLLCQEKVVEIYFRKDDRPVTEKNQEMLDEFQKMLEKKEDDFYPFLFRSKFTFSIVTPQNYKTIADAIYNANQNIAWYKENKHPEIAEKISEYGIAYCQYSYSLPRPVTELFQLFMMVNYSDFFEELGFRAVYYNREARQFSKELILQAIDTIQEAWRSKYPEMKFRTDKLRFENLMAFNQSFTSEVEYLNLESR